MYFGLCSIFTILSYIGKGRGWPTAATTAAANSIASMPWWNKQLVKYKQQTYPALRVVRTDLFCRLVCILLSDQASLQVDNAANALILLKTRRLLNKYLGVSTLFYRPSWIWIYLTLLITFEEMLTTFSQMIILKLKKHSV